MFGIRYIKASPTTHLIHYASGRIRHEGAGISFLYYAPTSTLVAVPLASADVPFVFNEPTADFQTVNIQGTLSYRVKEPNRLAGLLDFTIDSNGSPLSDDPEALNHRLVHATQVLAHSVAGRMALRQALVSMDAIVAEVLAGLKKHEAVQMLGLEILDLSILAVRPTPEIAKALEAEAREALQRNADEAIYARRKNAVEQERTIKESELNTELAVEEKRRQIREAQMKAEIAVEEQRAELIEQRTENDKKDADARAYALNVTLKPVRDIDWRTLTALNSGGDPRNMIAIAFRELAQNAGKIGELNISPDLLQTLLKK